MDNIRITRISGSSQEKIVLEAPCIVAGECTARQLLGTKPSDVFSGQIYGHSAHTEQPGNCPGTGNCGADCAVKMIINKR